MFRKLTDFYRAWTYESESTIKMFQAMKAGEFLDNPSENFRSMARLSWHITESVAELLHQAGLKEVDGIVDATKEKNDLNQLITEYQKSSDSLIIALKNHWTDEMLSEQVPMYGEQWTRGAVLSILIRHQTHHRGQLSVLIRQEGLSVPGMYGPSKEEWIAMGMKPLS